MTDRQIANFIAYRAKANGQLLGLKDPTLIIYKYDSWLGLGIKYANYKDIFMVRFIQGDVRGIFKIKCDNADPLEWKTFIDNIKSSIAANCIAYSPNDPLIPACVKHFISYAIIEALKTKNVGFDLFSISYGTDPSLVDPSETYEEAAIETDLMCFEMEELNI